MLVSWLVFLVKLSHKQVEARLTKLPLVDRVQENHLPPRNINDDGDDLFHFAHLLDPHWLQHPYTQNHFQTSPSAQNYQLEDLEDQHQLPPPENGLELGICRDISNRNNLEVSDIPREIATGYVPANWVDCGSNESFIFCADNENASQEGAEGMTASMQRNQLNPEDILKTRILGRTIPNFKSGITETEEIPWIASPSTNSQEGPLDDTPNHRSNVEMRPNWHINPFIGTMCEDLLVECSDLSTNIWSCGDTQGITKGSDVSGSNDINPSTFCAPESSLCPPSKRKYNPFSGLELCPEAFQHAISGSDIASKTHTYSSSSSNLVPYSINGNVHTEKEPPEGSTKKIDDSLKNFTGLELKRNKNVIRSVQRHTKSNSMPEKFANVNRPLPFILEIQARGEFLAQPLIPADDLKMFFKGLMRSLETMIIQNSSQDMIMIKRAVRNAETKVTYAFLGTLQILHEKGKGIRSQSLADTIIQGWDFLKKIFQQWKTLELNFRNVSQSRIIKGFPDGNAVDWSSGLETVQYYMYHDPEASANHAEGHLGYLLETWHAQNGETLSKEWDHVSDYEKWVSGIHADIYIVDKEAHPCLYFFKPSGDHPDSRMFQNLQYRGEFIANAFKTNVIMKTFFSSLCRVLVSKLKADCAQEKKIKSVSERLRRWVAHRFIGSLQILYVNDRILGRETRYRTLQEEISEAWDFLQKMFKTFYEVNPENHAWIFHRKHPTKPNLHDNFSDCAKVLNYYMHMTSQKRPSNVYVMQLLIKWRSGPSNKCLGYSQRELDYYHQLLECSYVTPSVAIPQEAEKTTYTGAVKRKYGGEWYM